MKTYRHIEQKMKEVASTQTTAAPGFVWDNIEDALKEDKTDRRGFIWFFLGGLFFLGGYLLLQSNFSETASTNHIVNQTIEKQENNIEPTIIPITPAKEVIPVQKVEEASKPEVTQLEDKKLNHSVATNKNNFQKKKTIPLVEKEFILPSEKIVETTINTKRVNNISELEFSKLNGLNYELPKLDYNRNKIACPTFGGKTINLNPFVEANGVGGIHFKNLDGAANQSLSDARNQTEKSWYSYGVNVAVGLNFTSNFYLGAGVEWSQSVDQFYYSDDAVTQMVITFDPETNLPIDTSLVLGMLENKGDVRYTMIDIPIFIGLTKQFRTFELGLEAGVLYNLSFQAEGKIINDQLDISRIVDENTIYKKELGLGLRTSLVFRKRMANGLAFQVKPTFKMYLDDINHADYILPTTLSFARLDIGIRKDF